MVEERRPNGARRGRSDQMWASGSDPLRARRPSQRLSLQTSQRSQPDRQVHPRDQGLRQRQSRRPIPIRKDRFALSV